MNTETFPHIITDGADCRCGARVETDGAADYTGKPGETWGADCPAALREALEAARQECETIRLQALTAAANATMADMEREEESDAMFLRLTEAEKERDAALAHVAELERATPGPHIPPALLRRIEALGFTPGSGEPVGWLVSEMERLKADHTALLLGVGHPMWLPSVADAVDHPDQFNATPDEVLVRVRAVVAERDELAATLANERGEGEPPSEGWEWDGEDWRAPGRAVTRYNRGPGWEPLLIGQDGSVIASPCPFDDGRTARAAMIAADAARSSTGGAS